MTSICIFGIIKNKFCYKKKLCIIILFKINKSFKINFYFIILLFSLAIYLKIKDNKKFLSNNKEVV